MLVTDILRQDHERVMQLFRQLEATPLADTRARQDMLDEIAEELEIHANVEEEIFYPAARGVSSHIGEAESEHARVKDLVGDVEGRDPASAEFARGLAALHQAVLHHVSEEEGEIFMEARGLGDDELERLGREVEERKQTLKTSLLQRGVRAAKQAARKIA